MERIPITVQRTPVNLSLQIRSLKRMEEMRMQSKPKDIISVGMHYTMLREKLTNNVTPNALAFIKQHIEYFESVYNLCLLKEWSPRAYLDAQFHRFKKFNTPYAIRPVNLCSVSSIKYFSTYQAEIKAVHEKDIYLKDKLEGSETKHWKERVGCEIKSSIETLSLYLQHNNLDNPPEFKTLELLNNWQKYSAYYLWSVTWFHSVLPELNKDNQQVKDYIHIFDTVSVYKPIQGFIIGLVSDLEKRNNIPPNLEI